MHILFSKPTDIDNHTKQKPGKIFQKSNNYPVLIKLMKYLVIDKIIFFYLLSLASPIEF